MTFRIDQKLLDTSLYLYPDISSAEQGQRAGGSGFVVGLHFDGAAHTMWAVTNRHVIDAGHWTIRLNTKDGGFTCLDSDDTQWFMHPDGDDLAVRPLAVPDGAIINYVPLESLTTKQMADILDIGPGDPAFVIGRFVSLDGKQKNTPSVRFGQISQLPSEKLKYDVYEQEAWLVEIRSLNGYSGSPVFCYLDQMYYRKNLKPIEGENKSLGKAYDHKGQIIGQGRFDIGPYLLGVDCCMIPLWEKVCD
ncbi:MAG: trypsin-like peptidase domain-containing protein [Sphingomonas sp.]|uniref:trypsin-like peptidase domain-containing protein n=1 Tax=Sphingomonas sp. TaxID=28214 RepID=UPI0017990562|nr:trypsin-like peptidase domain-containing protein [Sphingomonas sp.]MBA3666487.1 trypsin-like peptidase domain-containing protein [Sphingomonas sp.]